MFGITRKLTQAVIRAPAVWSPRFSINPFSNAAAPHNFGKLVKNNKVVVFMKGVPEQPQCGFSNAVVQILRMHGVQYDAHNVLADEAIRQGTKSNHPLFIQLA